MEDVEESRQVSGEKQAKVEQHRSRIQKTSGCKVKCACECDQITFCVCGGVLCV